MNDSVTITLRNIETSNISIFFEQQLGPEANRMAAFVRKDSRDEVAFDAHWKQILDSTGIVNKTILCGNEVAGHIFVLPPVRELQMTYCLGKKHWGEGSRSSSPQETTSRNHSSAAIRKSCERQHWIGQGATEMRFQDYRRKQGFCPGKR